MDSVRYDYFLPGYTGHCPFLRDRFKTYPQATRDVLSQYPHVGSRLRYIPMSPPREKPVELPELKPNAYGDAIPHRCSVYPNMPDYVSGYTGHIPTNMCNTCDSCHRRCVALRHTPCSCKPRRFNREGGDVYAVHPNQTIPDGSVVAARILPMQYKKCYCKDCFNDTITYAKPIPRCPYHNPWEPTAITPTPRQFYMDQPGITDVSIQTEGRLLLPPSREFRRFGIRDGMVPNYTGYVPGYLFAVGETYGKATRRLVEKHFRRQGEM